jgi:hypothetical protein
MIKNSIFAATEGIYFYHLQIVNGNNYSGKIMKN